MPIYINNNWIKIPKDTSCYLPIKNDLTFYERDRMIYSKGRKIKISGTVNRVYSMDLDGTMYVPVGLYGLLQDYITLDVEVIDERFVQNKNLLDTDFYVINMYEFDDILSGITLYKEQLMCIRKILYAKRGIINAATGFGKSAVMAGSIKILTMMNKNICPTVLVLEPTIKLVNDMISTFKSYGIDAVAYSDSRQIEKNKVNIAHPKSLGIDLSKNPKVLDSVEALFGDECLHKDSLILLSNGEVETIENIYNNPNITEVMSYNFEKECYEVKPILRKMKTEYNERFWKIKYINPITGKEDSLLATPNHKIWTYTRGYVRVDELTLEDEIKVDVSEKTYTKKYVCPYCGKNFTDHNELGGHVAWCEVGPYRENTLAKSWTKNPNYTSPLANKETFKKAMQSRSNNENYCKYLSDRMKEKNPSYNAQTVEKQKLSAKKFYESNPEKLEDRKCRFIKASHSNNHITNLEQMIIDLHIPGLEFTGNGKIIYLANNRRKIPDFTFRNGDEVKYIEISSTYWYDLDYINQIKKDYADAGLDVLYITDEDLSDLEGRIRKFLFNHRVKITKISKSAGRPSAYKYNLEVADNHNYFANNILVSNCHHLQSDTFRTPTYNMPNLVYSIGVSASAICQEHVKNSRLNQYTYEELLIIGATGNLLMNITADYLIQKGILAKPVLFRIDHKANEELKENEEKDWHIVNTVRLQSKERNKKVCKAAKIFSENNRKTLILVSTIGWARDLLKLFSVYGLGKKVFASYGSGKFETYDFVNNKYISTKENCFEKFDSGEYSIVIGTTHMYEGIDIKALDVIVLAWGGKAERLQIQGCGRALRKSKTGKFAYIVDFTDTEDNFLRNQSSARMKRYVDTIGIPKDHIFNKVDVSQVESVFKSLEM